VHVSLDPATRFGEIAAPNQDLEAMDTVTQQPAGRRILWQNVSTVLSAAILIGAEVFGAAFAGGWAFANLFHLGEYGVYVSQIVLFVIGVIIMINFVRAGMKIEPFTARE
jgi:hypothetical protein